MSSRIEAKRYGPPDPLPGLEEVDKGPKPVLKDITVVIPTLGRRILEKCLASILAGDHWPACVIVVHQGSDAFVGDLVASLEKAGVVSLYLVSPHIGRAAGLNQGIDRVESKYFAVTDDDCVVAPDWLAQMLAALVTHPNTAVSGRVEDAGDEEAVALALSMTAETRTKPSLIFDSWSGGNSGMPMAVFRKVGLFDEDPRLRLAEDTEWAYRALRAGVDLVYSPDICVWHYAWRDTQKRAEQYRGYARSHGSYYGKYIRRGDLFLALKALVHVGRSLRRWIRGTVRRDPNMTAHGRAYTLSLVPGLLQGWRNPPSDIAHDRSRSHRQ